MTVDLDLGFIVSVLFTVCRSGLGMRDSFITHRALCDALAEESGKKGPGAQTSDPKPPAEEEKATATEEETAAEEVTAATEAAVETAPAAVVAAPLPPQQVAPLELQGWWFSVSSLSCPSLFGLVSDCGRILLAHG